MFVFVNSVDRCLCISWVFFFQAEDGIRDLVRSRGLGDVYKRQGRRALDYIVAVDSRRSICFARSIVCHRTGNSNASVSYTHLTLPTSDLV